MGLKLGRQKIVTISTYDFVKQALLQDDFNGRPESFSFKIRAFGKKKGLILYNHLLIRSRSQFEIIY